MTEEVTTDYQLRGGPHDGEIVDVLPSGYIITGFEPVPAVVSDIEYQKWRRVAKYEDPEIG